MTYARRFPWWLLLDPACFSSPDSLSLSMANKGGSEIRRRAEKPCPGRRSGKNRKQETLRQTLAPESMRATVQACPAAPKRKDTLFACLSFWNFAGDGPASPFGDQSCRGKTEPPPCIWPGGGALTPVLQPFPGKTPSDAGKEAASGGACRRGGVTGGQFPERAAARIR